MLKKNKLFEAIQKGKIIDDRAAYLAGILRKKGGVILERFFAAQKPFLKMRIAKRL